MTLKCLDLSQLDVFDRVCGWFFDLFFDHLTSMNLMFQIDYFEIYTKI